MIERPMAVAKPGCCSDRFLYKCTCALYGIDECNSFGKTAGDRRRKRAACSMRVAAVDARRTEHVNAFKVDEHIFDHITARMTAFDERG